MLGGDELELKGLLKVEADEAAVVLANTLILATVDAPAEELAEENVNPVPELELNGFANGAPAPNGELPNPPDVDVVAPNETVPGPDEEAPAPKDTVPGPDEADPDPKDKVPGPDEAAPTPKGTIPEPDEEDPALKEKIPGPDEGAAAPKADEVPGVDEAPTPKDMVPEPVEEAAIPKEKVPDPDDEDTTPGVTDGNEPNCGFGLWDGCCIVSSGCVGLPPKSVLAADG